MPRGILKSNTDVNRRAGSNLNTNSDRFLSPYNNRNDDLFVIQEVSEPSNLASTIYMNNRNSHIRNLQSSNYLNVNNS